MKNKVLVLLVSAIMCSGLSMAQSSDFGERISIGAKVGANISNVYDAQGDEFDADAKLGFAFGGFVQIPIGKFIGFHPEVLFSQKGYKGSGSVLGTNYDYKRTLNYIDVPLLLAIKPIPFITILVGPQYSYLISQKYALNTVLGGINEEEQIENENLRKNTLCATGGFDVNINNIVLGARVGWDFLKNEGNGASSTPRYKNTWFQASVGFRF